MFYSLFFKLYDQFFYVLIKTTWTTWDILDVSLLPLNKVHSGTDPSVHKQSVYVEFVDSSETAAKDFSAKIAEGQVVQVDYDCYVKEYTDKTGAARFETRLSGCDVQVFSDRAF